MSVVADTWRAARRSGQPGDLGQQRDRPAPGSASEAVRPVPIAVPPRLTSSSAVSSGRPTGLRALATASAHASNSSPTLIANRVLELGATQLRASRRARRANRRSACSSRVAARSTSAERKISAMRIAVG